MQFYFVHTLHNTYIAVLFCHLVGTVWGKQDAFKVPVKEPIQLIPETLFDSVKNWQNVYQ